MTHQQKLDLNLELPSFSVIYLKCMFVDFLSEYIDSPICVHRRVWSS